MSSSLPETVKEFQKSTIENINSYNDPISCSLPSFKPRSNQLTYEKLLDACNQRDVLTIIDDIYNIDITSFGVCDKKIFNRVSNAISSSNMNINYTEYINNALCHLYLIKYLTTQPSYNNEQQIKLLKDWSKQKLVENIIKTEKQIQDLFTTSAVEVDNTKRDQIETDKFISSINLRIKALNPKKGGSKSVKRRKTHRRKSIKRTRSIKRRGTKQRQQGVKRRRTKSRR